MRANNKNNNSFDDHFIDQAWENMRSTLDKEMPEKKKKRRFIPFFYLMTGCLIGFIFWYGLSTFQSIENNESIAVNHTPIDQIERSKNEVGIINEKNNNKTTIRKDETKQPKIIEDASAPSIENNSTNFSNNEISNKTKTQSTDNQEVANILYNNTTISTFEQLHGLTSSQAVNSSPIVVKTDDLTASQTVSQNTLGTTEQNATRILLEKEKNENSLLENIAFLPTQNLLIENSSASHLQLTDLSFEKIEFPVEEKLDILPPKRKVEFGVNGGITYDFSVSNKIGLTTGLKVHFPVGKKWGIQTGLAYSSLAKNKSYTSAEEHPVVLADDFQLIDTTTNTNSTPVASAELSSFSLESNTTFKLVRTHYLELPLLVTYQLGKKWQLQAGLNFSKALKGSARTDDQEFSLIDNNPSYDLSIENVRTANFNTLNVPTDVWKDDFASAVLGISWKVSKKMNIGFQYHYRTSNIFSSGMENADATLSTAGGFSGPNVNAVQIIDPSRNNTLRTARITLGYRF